MNEPNYNMKVYKRELTLLDKLVCSAVLSFESGAIIARKIDLNCRETVTVCNALNSQQGIFYNKPKKRLRAD